MSIGQFLRILIVRFSSLFYSSKRSKVIFYHDIHSSARYTDMSTSVDLFQEHVKIIRDAGYDIVSKITKKHNQIEISFDDGFLGIYKNIDVITNLKIPINLFIISSKIGKKNYLNQKQLIELSKIQQVQVCSHTHQHKILPNISDNEVFFECQQSKNILENIIQKDVNLLCFPEGIFNQKIVEIAKKAGYKILYSSIPGFYFNDFLVGVKKRSLVQFANKKEFQAILRGGDHLLSAWYSRKHYKS